MVEVFLIGALVSVVKISSMASIQLGFAFWAFIGFTLCTIASVAMVDRVRMWRANFPPGSAAAHGLQSCLRCSTLAPTGNTRCRVCGKALFLRRPQSLQWTLAFLLTAVVLYVPANLLPIMDTAEHGSYPTAAIIFVASVLVPVAKIIALLWLCYTVAQRSPHNPHERERLYRITEFIGRWSMVDVFVVALLVALVQVTGILTVAPGSAALAFCGMVVFTMLAADSFDSRLIWDHAYASQRRTGKMENGQMNE